MSRIRYPRTAHHPLSPGATSDDVRAGSMAALAGREVVITAKLDGESFTGTRDFCHARSLDSGYHPTRTRSIALWHGFRHELPPPPFRVCCEHLQGRHSIAYAGLPSPLFVLNVWDERNVALSWDDTEQWGALLGLPVAPVLYRGPYDEARFLALTEVAPPWSDEAEGVVVRVVDPIPYDAWPTLAAKWVRTGHVQTGAEHWMHRSDVPENTFAS
ncbi:MAG TPA: RNA ligase family protein [Solirubrobacteraceae bacterium]|nr:RNA ligase family protein [Solirubrobacteraceae bacterium]